MAIVLQHLFGDVARDVHDGLIARAALGQLGDERVPVVMKASLHLDELLWGFDIQLQEGRIVAVCNVPEGWTISAENYGEAAAYRDGGGRAHGGADFGHDALSVTDLSQLGWLLLIDRSAVHRKSVTLTGFITTSGPSDNRKVAETGELRAP